MTPSELKALTYFRDGERDIHGQPIDWDTADYQTMVWLERLRQRLDSPITIIRATHPGKPSAIDWCCPGRRYREVVMEVLRLPLCSYGFYSGNSVHIDMRDYAHLPARWLAIKESQRAMAIDRGLTRLLGPSKNGWIYLGWDFDALNVVVRLAEAAAGAAAEV